MTKGPATLAQSAVGTPAVAERAVATVDLDIGGMTCASCSARIKRQLNRLPGFEASLNQAIAGDPSHY